MMPEEGSLDGTHEKSDTRALEKAHRRINELARAFQELERDRENYRIRLAREREQLLDVERGEVALALLETIDDLERALAKTDDTPLAKGVRQIRDGLVKKAVGLGLERLSLIGTTFDPGLAEAVDVEITLEASQDKVVTEELRAGYRLKGRVVQPARVRVARYVEPLDV
jgi:molecular chaperone GrpE